MGVGFQDPESNRDWVEDQKFPYEIWQDVDRILSLHYGAADSVSAFAPSRVTMLLDAEGRAVAEYRPVKSVGDHAAEVLEDCKKFFPPAAAPKAP